ncbi:MAG: hypothetical protein JJE30_04240 [Desulfuromonadales bacterium]|nr:hypothetical protein [Desulfuromonadales bacterium]
MPRISRGEFGTFRAEKQPGAIRLKWDKGPSVAADELVTALASLQQSNARANMGEAIFKGMPEIQSVLRVKEWHSYLIKTASTKNKWIYLNINPSDAAHYPAKASAAFPEADIFCARLVSDDHARKLTGDTPVSLKAK